MKSNIKLIFKYLIYGISWGCTFLVIFGLIGTAIGGKTFSAMLADDFIRQAAGAIIVGISCGSSAVVYQFERLSFSTKVLIHFVVGMGVFYPTALYLKWIPHHPGQILYTVSQMLISCGIFVLIWLFFYFFNRSEAKKINNRLRELEESDSSQDR